MNDLLELSKKIQACPDHCKTLIKEFQTSDEKIKAFVYSLNYIEPFLVPAFIETFVKSQPSELPRTIGELAESKTHLGAIFVLCEDNTDWTYEGVNSNGEIMCRTFNSPLLIPMNPEHKIEYVF